MRKSENDVETWTNRHTVRPSVRQRERRERDRDRDRQRDNDRVRESVEKENQKDTERHRQTDGWAQGQKHFSRPAKSHSANTQLVTKDGLPYDPKLTPMGIKNMSVTVGS